MIFCIVSINDVYSSDVPLFPLIYLISKHFSLSAVCLLMHDMILFIVDNRKRKLKLYIQNTTNLLVHFSSSIKC